MGLSNYKGASAPPARRPEGEPLHSLKPSAELEAKWEKVRERLKASADEFLWHIWLMHPRVVHEQGSTLFVEAPRHMFTTISERYNGHILLAAREVLGEMVTIEYVRHGWRPEGAPTEVPHGQRMAAELGPQKPEPRVARSARTSYPAGEGFTDEVEEEARRARRALACAEHGWNATDGKACPSCRAAPDRQPEEELADAVRQAKVAPAPAPRGATGGLDDPEVLRELGLPTTSPPQAPRGRRRSDVTP